jgi:hypothetical protein
MNLLLYLNRPFQLSPQPNNEDDDVDELAFKNDELGPINNDPLIDGAGYLCVEKVMTVEETTYDDEVSNRSMIF